MKRIPIFALITLVAAAAVAAPGRGPAAGGPQGRGAQGPGPHGSGPGEVLSPGLLAELLDLTEAQIAQVQALRDTHRAAVEPLREQQKANREQIRAAAEAGDAAQAGQLVVANHGIGDQIRAAREAFESGFAALLTSEQKEKWDVYREIAELRRQRPE